MHWYISRIICLIFGTIVLKLYQVNLEHLDPDSRKALAKTYVNFYLIFRFLLFCSTAQIETYEMEREAK